LLVRFDEEVASEPLRDNAMMTAQESMQCARNVILRVIGVYGERASLVTDIAADVGAEIIEEVIQPGHDLNSVELARRYDTSRTPIREALMLLEKEGLVDIPPRRRPRAKVLDVKTVREIYRTRATLLEFIAADVAELASEADIAKLRAQLDVLERLAEANDVRAYMWANIEFYDLNSDASGNMTAKRIVESLLLRTISLRRWSLSQPGRLAESIDDHRRLARAYEQRDAHLAAAIMRSNHMTALKNIEHRFQQQTKPTIGGGRRMADPGLRSGPVSVSRQNRKVSTLAP
jgi:DNA-binding GntR family transcriptional regulator